MGVLLAEASLHANRRQGCGLPRPSESSQKLFQKDLLDQSHCDDLLQEVHATEEGLEAGEWEEGGRVIPSYSLRTIRAK